MLIGTAVCIRLGIWQLDRLEQRRSFNAHVEAMWNADLLIFPDDSDLKLEEMEYRSVCISGNYDFDHQVALRNQYWEDQYGYHLITPLVMSDGYAVLVDRGWIPAIDNDSPEEWRRYDEGLVGELCGIIRLGREKPDVGGRPDPTLAPGEERLDIWNNVNIVRLRRQIPYQILNIYIQVDPDDDVEPPVPFQPDIEISEGPHLGYAGQWFTFATILFFGYPFFIRWRESKE